MSFYDAHEVDRVEHRPPGSEMTILVRQRSWWDRLLGRPGTVRRFVGSRTTWFELVGDDWARPDAGYEAWLGDVWKMRLGKASDLGTRTQSREDT